MVNEDYLEFIQDMENKVPDFLDPEAYSEYIKNYEYSSILQRFSRRRDPGIVRYLSGRNRHALTRFLCTGAPDRPLLMSTFYYQFQRYHVYFALTVSIAGTCVDVALLGPCFKTGRLPSL